MRRDLLNRENQNFKFTIAGMMREIQTLNQPLNQHLSDLNRSFSVEIQKSAIEQSQKLESKVESIQSALNYFHDEYSNNAKYAIGLMMMAFNHNMPLWIERRVYNDAIKKTEDIEKGCRPFTRMQFGFVEIDKK